MSVLAVAALRPRPRTRQRRGVERSALRALLQVVLADSWHADDAARTLLVATHRDRRVLRQLRAHVHRAVLDRPSEVAARAEATLDSALATLVAEEAAAVGRESTPSA